MKNIFFKATPYLALFLSSVTQAQETKTVTTVNNKKGQNTIITILLPNFLHQNGTESRSASGAWGKILQNSRLLTAILNEKNNEIMVQKF
jgi:hypothetical protein